MPMAGRGLVKLGEECSEVAQVCMKKMALKSLDERTHFDGTDLHAWLEDEIGDVLAAIDLVVRNFKLDESKISARYNQKSALFDKWDADSNS